MANNVNYTRLSYNDVKGLMEKKLAGFKKGLIPKVDREELAESWAEEVDVAKLDPQWWARTGVAATLA